jgi:ectoine hydroxylase-related dioxygenase (phytanoyl-CoA dioxygenase family)
MLTPAQRYEFDLKGCLVLRQAVSADLVQRLDRALARLEGRGPEELPLNTVPSWTPAINEYRLMGLLECDETFHELIDHPSLLGPARELVPQPCRLAEAYSITRLRGFGVPLHSQPESDYRLTHAGPRTALLKCVVNLGDVGPEDGPMIVFEGTHKLDVPFPFNLVHPDWKPTGVDGEIEQIFLAESKDKTKIRWEDIPGYRELHVQAGDVILMTDDLWHGAKSLNSNRRRRTLYYSFVPYHYPNWHGIPYSKELKARVNASRRQLLAGPFVGTRYATFDTSELGEGLPFPRLPNSTRDPKRFATFKDGQPEYGAGGDLAQPHTPIERALAALTEARPASGDHSQLAGTAEFHLSGSEGGQYSVHFAPGSAHWTRGQSPVSTCRIELDSADLLAVSRGEADPVQLFYEGKARARGDISFAMRLVDRWSR